MSPTILYTVAVVSGLGAIAALILYFVSTKFKVVEDPRIDDVEEALPGANCGGCGYPGCRGFAEALVREQDLDRLHCPPGGNEVMGEIADILGLQAVEKDPFVAVVRCSGGIESREKVNIYDGVSSCSIAAQLYSGDTGCAHGCLGLGECVDACTFDAMYMDEKTGLPVVIQDKCTACNACVTACPKDIIELRPMGRRNRRIYVSCMNEEKGGVAKKHCSSACTACNKCEDVCRYDAVTIENNLAYIDAELCKLCQKCVDVCASQVIQAVNFPPKKVRPAKDEDKPKRERAPRPDKAKAAAPEASATGEVDVIAMATKLTKEDKKDASDDAAKE